MVHLTVQCEMQFSSYWLQRHRAGQKPTPFILIALNNIGQSSWQKQNTKPPFGEWENVWDQAQDLLSTWLEPLRCNTNPYSHLKFKDKMTWIAFDFKKPIRSKVNHELPELFEEKRGKRHVHLELVLLEWLRELSRKGAMNKKCHINGKDPFRNLQCNNRWYFCHALFLPYLWVCILFHGLFALN